MYDSTPLGSLPTSALTGNSCLNLLFRSCSDFPLNFSFSATVHIHMPTHVLEEERMGQEFLTESLSQPGL